jgi:hypothetical protein
VIGAVDARRSFHTAAARGRIGMTEHDDDPNEITISDEDLDRAMRVYTPEEAMDFLKAGDGLPSRRQPTLVWQEFLARMRAGPQTPAIQAAIRVAQRELLWRRDGSA